MTANQNPSWSEETRKAGVISNALAAADKVIIAGATDEKEILDFTLALCNALIQKSMYLVHQSRSKAKMEPPTPSGTA